MNTLTLLTVRAVSFLIAVLVFSLVFMYPVQVAVNHLFSSTAMLAVFGVPYLSLPKAYGLSFLTALLFRTVK